MKIVEVETIPLADTVYPWREACGVGWEGMDITQHPTGQGHYGGGR